MWESTVASLQQIPTPDGRVAEMAARDGLTGIYNRRFFEMQIASEIERASRYDGRLAIIMIDIDHFKRLNDEF